MKEGESRRSSLQGQADQVTASCDKTYHLLRQTRQFRQFRQHARMLRWSVRQVLCISWLFLKPFCKCSCLFACLSCKSKWYTASSGRRVRVDSHSPATVLNIDHNGGWLSFLFILQVYDVLAYHISPSFLLHPLHQKLSSSIERSRALVRTCSVVFAPPSALNPIPNPITRLHALSCFYLSIECAISIFDSYSLVRLTTLLLFCTRKSYYL